jgi:hypothetical protein
MYKNFLLKKAEPFKKLGYKIMNDGTELFGNDKDIAPQAWLHQIYPPLTSIEIIRVEELIGQNLPNSLVNFYNEMNGCSVFVRQLTIAGLRKNFSGSIESSWQPFSLETKNKHERPKNAKKEYIFIGSYSASGNIVYMDSNTEKVSICAVENADPIATYENLFHFLLEELTAIFTLNESKYNKKI